MPAASPHSGHGSSSAFENHFCGSNSITFASCEPSLPPTMGQSAYPAFGCINAATALKVMRSELPQRPGGDRASLDAGQPL